MTPTTRAWAYRTVFVLVFVSCGVLAYLDGILVAWAIVSAIVLMAAWSISSRMSD